jgi:hypothetical protein
MNKVIKKLKVILGLLIISSTVVYAQNQPSGNSAPKPSFTIDETVFDYGEIPEDGGLANHTFTLTNTGNSPLVIKQVTTTCGCTTPIWEKAPIAPGKTGEIKVAFNPQGRPGPFKKIISVYCYTANPVNLVITGNVGKNCNEPRVPDFTPEETSHNFGEIGENDGYAEHIFKFRNTGEAPLVISRITASCGCTRPEWPQAPVQPGEDGQIIITFNPRGRVGPFNKIATVYTNEDNGYKRHSLAIRGVVSEKPADKTYVRYIDTIGNVGIEKNKIEYKTFSLTGVNKDVINIKNYNTEAVYFSWENTADHITVKSPDSLKADWPGEISILADGTKSGNRRGRITDKLTLTIKDRTGKVLGSENVNVTTNYLDDFSKLSPLQKVSAASIDINNTKLDFGEIKKGKPSKQFVITNTGKSDLTLHTVTCDNPDITLPDLKGKIIKAGESLTVKVIIKGKELNNDINSDIYLVSNAPKSPIRLIQVTAQKAK